MKIKYLIVLLIIISCSKKESESIEKTDSIVKPTLTKEEIRLKDSIELEKKIEEADIYPEIKYQKIILSSKKLKDSIYKEYKWSKKNKTKNKIFITLNEKRNKVFKVR